MTMSYKEQVEYFKGVKEKLHVEKVDYLDISMQSSYRKLRHHLDQLIVKLDKLPSAPTKY